MTPILAALAFATAAAAQPDGCAALSTLIFSGNGGWRAHGAAPAWRVDDGGFAIDDDGARVYDASVESPAFAVPNERGEIVVEHSVDVSWASTAAVLDVSIDGAPWRDFVAAGGRFDGGGYDATSYRGNPLGERAAWGGTTALLTRAVLPRETHGKHVRLRFRIGSGGSGDARAGWRIGRVGCAW
ncbi:hypothetical protein [Tahibacter soli]|jgi:hypothetical protein|uniref:Discoidin domain-containing protein n=1 Tax=Tahibacter soli TaxID=2983605 RepID=A0A9X3YMT1_9GAMM|nr:hypothetical protein [Tahibacter soli]MDC8013613.1 hypothetical protein [Tahibacter soli]